MEDPVPSEPPHNRRLLPGVSKVAHCWTADLLAGGQSRGLIQES